MDRYLRAMLRVIALALLWLCVECRLQSHGASAMAASSAPDVAPYLRAHGFDLVESDGTTRASLTMEPQHPGNAILFLGDAKSKVKIALRVYTDGNVEARAGDTDLLSRPAATVLRTSTGGGRKPGTGIGGTAHYPNKPTEAGGAR